MPDAYSITTQTGDELDELFAGLPPLISVKRAADLVGLTYPTAYRYAQQGDLPVKRVGRRRVFVVTARLRRWLDTTDGDFESA